ncbi:tetratricopeptide repeat protein [Lacticaseibacillus saniviri]
MPVDDTKRDQLIHQLIEQIDTHPDQVGGYVDLITMLTSVGSLDQASELYLRAQERFNDASLTYAGGLLDYAREQYQQGITDLMPLLDDADYRADAAYMLGLMYQKLSQPQQALAFALIASDADADAEDAALLVANLLLTQGYFEQVTDRLEPLLKHDSAAVNFTYGLAMNAQEKDGRPYLEKAEQLDPETYAQQTAQLRDISRFLNVRGRDDGNA